MTRKRKAKAIVVLGEGPVREYTWNGLRALKECLSSEGRIVKRIFDTEEERKAYIKGIDDATGWLESCVIDDDDMRRHSRMINKILENED